MIKEEPKIIKYDLIFVKRLDCFILFTRVIIKTNDYLKLSYTSIIAYSVGKRGICIWNFMKKVMLKRKCW